eukprot:TRINITY_DN595_c0_g1_i1.p1 TRINITY_DN595_c0_g1~~TRINITY_DN595_c0_g1_i1.p1  ORF type:complete len:399 (-),score=70.24 TRINITY_DN595_c0_g1_i1:61-1212(-)
MKRIVFSAALAIVCFSSDVLSQPTTCARPGPPPGMGTPPVSGQNCPPLGTPPPFAPAPRTSGPCGAPCPENTWYGNRTISPLKSVDGLRTSCIPFACGYNYTNWEGALHGDHGSNAIGYPVDSNGGTPTAFSVECTSEVDQARVLVSNSLPSKFAYIQQPGNLPCEAPYFVKLPLYPQVVDDTNGAYEVPLRGPIALTLDGIAVFNAQDVGGTDAIASGLANWVGHSTPTNLWHYHGSNFPVRKQTVVPQYPKQTDLVAYAFDGFPIYGPLEDDSDVQLDVCNGRWVESEDDEDEDEHHRQKYQYHMKKISAINTSSPYCVDWQTSVANQWNYILGCYSGSPLNSLVTSYVADSTVLPLASHYKCKVRVGKKSDVRSLIGGDL